MEDEREEEKEEYPSDRSDQTDRSDKDRNGKAGPAAAPAATADNVLGMCNVEGCTGDALRDGICKRHLMKLAMGCDPDAAEAVRRWHAVHDIQPETPRVPHWKRYPDAACGHRKAEGGSAEPGRRNGKLNAELAENAEDDHAAEDGEDFSQGQEQEENTTMGKSKRIKCSKCGREIGAQAYDRHVAACKGPEPTTFPCPTCKKGHKSERALHCHEAHTGHGGAKGNGGTGSQEQGTRKRKYSRRIKPAASAGSAVFPPPGSGFRVPGSAVSPPPGSAVSSGPPDGIAAVGHALLRLVELLGLSGQISDCPDLDGHLFINAATGDKAVVTAAGNIYAAELVRRIDA